MKPRLLRMVSVLITMGVVSLLVALKSLYWIIPGFDFIERLERMSYDWRVRFANSPKGPSPEYIGAVFVDELTLEQFNAPGNGGFQYPLPRFLYGYAVEELAAQGAKAIAFDIFFLDRNYERDHLVLRAAEGAELPSDAYFAQQLRRAGNVHLAAPPRVQVGGTLILAQPLEFFRTNALGVGFTSLEIDSDGVRRRVRPFIDDPEAGRRFWHLGILLAAIRLNLDLDKAVVEPGRVILSGQGGLRRELPLEPDGSFYVRWSLPVERLGEDQQNNLFFLCADHQARKQGQPRSSQFRNKLVVIGAAGAGNNVGDRGPTPLQKETILCSSIWNIAASVVDGDFVRRSPLLLELLLVSLMAALGAVVSTRLRAGWASAAVFGIAAGYVLLTALLYARTRYWLPIVLPVGGALLMTYACLVCYRLVVELVERRRVRFIRATFGQRFDREVVDLLVDQEAPRDVVRFLGLPPSVVRMLVQRNLADPQAGVRRRVSIYFADIRDFTGFIDRSQGQAEEHILRTGLPAEEAERYMDLAVRDLLGTVNLYLSTIAEVVRAHAGTLDKYVGDAVMAFWGAPNSEERHAVMCVRAAIAAQRAITTLNEQRQTENQRRLAAAERGTTPPNLLPVLTVGMAINTGDAVVGFMGSAALMSNYTVFGREVNIASRLEGIAGSGRIVISEATYQELRRLEPSLADSCIALEPVSLRGIGKPVRPYELPAHPGQAAAVAAGTG